MKIKRGLHYSDEMTLTEEDCRLILRGCTIEDNAMKVTLERPLYLSGQELYEVWATNYGPSAVWDGMYSEAQRAWNALADHLKVPRGGGRE